MINNKLYDRLRQKQKMDWGGEEECIQLNASHLRNEVRDSSLSIDR